MSSTWGTKGDDTIRSIDQVSAADAVGRLLRLVDEDRATAAKAVAALGVEQQVALVCSTPVRRRREILDLLPEPERVIPALPEAELCFIVKAIGLEDATWVLEHATPGQVAAAVDLDVWHGHAPAPARLDAWLDALATTGDEALLRSLRHLDAELVVQWLKGRVAVELKPSGDEDWEPPASSQTLDGQFYFVQLTTGDDAASILRALHVLWQGDYWTYFRMLQGVIHELPTENQEWGLRWRNARLQDLGFPAWDEAMEIYRYLDDAERARLPEEATALDVEAWRLPVWLPQLPEHTADASLLFRAIARLADDERRAAFYAFVAVANAVAVADHMPLSESETTPRAIEKAARWIEGGLLHLVDAHGVDATEVLRRVSLKRLFCVGANLDPDTARPAPAPDDEGVSDA